MNIKIWRDLLILLLLFGGIWAGFSYYNYEIDSNPFSISKENEEEMSEFLNEYMMSDFEIIDNPPLDSCLNIIMTRLTQNMDTVSYDYQVSVIQDEQINAFTSLNGQIYIYTGLISKLDRPEELALILAHEIGHAENKHVIEKIAKTIGMEALFSIASGGDPVLISEIAKLSVSTAFDRKNEEEADDYALNLAIVSELNPSRLGQFFIKMKAENKSFLNDLEFIRTHPMDNDRIQKSAEVELPIDFEEKPIELDWNLVKEMI
ncbi:MAG: M48 family metallopeptidase [Reichenbachiella sp.]